MVEDGKRIANGIGMVGVVCDENDGYAAFAGTIDQPKDVAALFDSKGGGWLIQNQNACSEMNGARNSQALFFPA